ncbi:MAG: chromate efflux transporter [Burkholderiales bacterium]
MRQAPNHSIPEIFLTFLGLGISSFGGPIAHLGYFRREFVEKRKWLTEHAYSDLVSLCQFLPGPASSQVGIALGLSRGAIPGAVAAWLGFTLPSAILLVLFGLELPFLGGTHGSGWLHGLRVVSVAVVAQALWVMGKPLARDRLRMAIVLFAAATATLFPSSAGQICAIAGGGFAGLVLPGASIPPHSPLRITVGRTTGMALLSLFFILLLALPFLAMESESYSVRLFDSFYRAGALVFGGGHVVLPLLQSQVVPSGWVSNDSFLAGYGAAQAVPGPLFTFSAYLGAVSSGSPAGWIGAGIALVAIFLPSFLLVVGILPFWEELRRVEALQKAMPGINAAVVGLLLAAFYNPVWKTAILSGTDFFMAAAAFLLLTFGKTPPWLVVILTAAAAEIPG